METRPSFLFVMTDQHRPDHTGFGGNPIVRTPHLDALASRSVRFDRAFVANPICMPNRSTILTGRMPSVHGTRFNGVALDWTAHTFVRVMREHGYRTGLVGKAHFQNMGDIARVPVERFFPAEGDAVVRPHPTGWDQLEDGDRHRREYVKIPEDFYGFDHVDLTVNHADICSGHYAQWLVEQGVDPSAVQGADHARTSFEDWSQVYQTALPEDLYPSSYVALRTIEFLEQAAQGEEPFFLQCSFPDPHHPFSPPGRFWEMYDPREIPLPETFDDPHTGSLPHYRTKLRHRGSQRLHIEPFAPTEAQLRHAAAAEYGMISLIDESVGRILGALERLGLSERTTVVFTSDHGDMFGDHGMLLKAGMHYEGCTRVPLLVARPGCEAAISRSLVGSIDLAQTLLDLAGLPAFHGMQGTSLVPLLDDPAASVRDHVLIEEDEIFDIARVGQPLRMRTLQTAAARLSLTQGSELGELFDLERDPLELDNLFGRAEARDLQAHLTEALARSMMETADVSPKPTKLA
jgi:arylsulfatase A-like enzyme